LYKILKFGGSSIKTASRIKNILEIIKSQQKPNYSIVVIVSAIGGITDKLISISKNIQNPRIYLSLYKEVKKYHIKIINELGIVKSHKIISLFEELELEINQNRKNNSLETLDKIISYGERFSSQIISEYFCSVGIESDSLDAREVIVTNDHFGSAFVYYEESYNKICEYFSNIYSTQIITGFIGSTRSGKTTTLGRSGSDYTASIFGAALNSDQIQIWTDVDGVLSANPKIIENAKLIRNLNYKEAMELAHAGAKVIFPPTMIPALNKNIPIWIKNTFNPESPGSLITQKSKKNNRIVVGISSQSGMALVRLQGAGMVGLYGIIGRIFTALAKGKINIILVSQVFSEHSICFVIRPEQIKISKKLLKEEFYQELKNHIIDEVTFENNISLIALVGEGMRQKSGISGKLFKTLGNENINIIAIAQGSSERNISFIVDDKQAKKTLKILHSEFFEITSNKTAVFLAGVGTVGSKLLKIAEKINSKKIDFNGVLNSKRMLLNPDGLNLSNIESDLKFNSIRTDLKNIIDTGRQFKNKIFVDCTSSIELSKKYSELLSNGFSIVAANKKANTMDINFYNKLRKITKMSHLKFKYETNVCAGLPVISSLKSLIKSGDKILKIEGVFSGTLSYLFNNFNGLIPFSELLKYAKENGFTEPDPRDDLSGKDVARKLLILAREIGLNMNLDDIQTESFVPIKSKKNSSISEFLDCLKVEDSKFESYLQKAKHQNKKLCYIGSLQKGKAKVKLEMISESHPFYHLDGSENIVSFQTERYNEKPLVIRGHGAGAEVTAGGVMADIMSILELK